MVFNSITPLPRHVTTCFYRFLPLQLPFKTVDSDCVYILRGFEDPWLAGGGIPLVELSALVRVLAEG